MAWQQDALRRAMYQASSSPILEEEDTRTLDEYLDQLEEWRDDLIEASIEAFPGAYVANGHGVLALEVKNPLRAVSGRVRH